MVLTIWLCRQKIEWYAVKGGTKKETKLINPFFIIGKLGNERNEDGLLVWHPCSWYVGRSGNGKEVLVFSFHKIHL